MTARLIEINDLSLAAKEILALGCDPVGVKLMAAKAVSRVIKLKNVRPVAANIIKQEMLSFGGEAATAYGAISHSVKATDLLIFGTLKQLKLLINKLRLHQFGLPKIANEIETCFNNYDRIPAPIKIGPKTFDFGRRTYIMGILNVTPDSFSDGGKFFDPQAALERAWLMIEAGADIIDVGGESTRPGAATVPAREELRRVLPVIKALARDRGAVISIDTRKAAVARAAIAAGADMVNDVSGLRYDGAMAKVIVKHKAPVCLMHMRGTPKTMQRNPVYADLMGEVIEGLAESIAIAENAGILLEKIIVDPGLGFGKTVVNNLDILKNLRELKALGRPILIGPSRKSMIGQALGLPPAERVEGTAAAAAVSIMNGAHILRVHDVREIFRVARLTDAIVRRRQ
ncbi:dihydropteroate synthase [candidate division WOR-1 bacterium RIFCSPHIGHO2_01_FULL_53_15]|uniref:Dihydropteroate synthase n=1 Tax=candidate division WOR-1 bacterium RIFCSPHIGHO2_01_FULL_53_15 TaxID=1802564 RepID=A0A1F4Q2R0_UNCSA|nr:MAG: dihydropteroate synthase [candidate division WOR-1 bacterium RIFCSPHIGHO2_01_FULL_53_15]OGC13213.1 MAG: dihydropteroate synthase [candidate division WOR-1 bacterium RIFCSPHIGHO2_02_FULL_53_26]